MIDGGILTPTLFVMAFPPSFYPPAIFHEDFMRVLSKWELKIEALGHFRLRAFIEAFGGRPFGTIDFLQIEGYLLLVYIQKTFILYRYV